MGTPSTGAGRSRSGVADRPWAETDVGQTARSEARALEADVGAPRPQAADLLRGSSAATLGDEIAAALVGVGLGWLAALLKPRGRSDSRARRLHATAVDPGSPSGPPGGAGEVAAPSGAPEIGKARLMLTFPSAPDRIPAGELADLVACLEGLWLVGESLADPPGVVARLPEQMVRGDGTVVRLPGYPGPVVLSVRYGSWLQILTAGGVAGATATALALITGVETIAVRWAAFRSRVDEEREQHLAGAAAHRAAGAKSDFEAQTFRAKTLALGRGSPPEVVDELFEVLERERTGSRFLMQGNLAGRPGEDAPPIEQVETQVRQLVGRAQQIAGTPEARLELPPSAEAG
jgi:hypothetical protein